MTSNNTATIVSYKRFEYHDGPGIRTTLFLKGCTLRCKWCHNPESVRKEPELGFYDRRCTRCGVCASVCPNGAQIFGEDGSRRIDREKCTVCGLCTETCAWGALVYYGRTVTVEEAASRLLEDKPFYDRSGGGVTVSGGEPLLQADFVAGLFARLKKEGVHTAVDTCGQVPWESFEKVLPLTDLFLYDVKHLHSEKHRVGTGLGNERILDNLRRLAACGAAIEVRIPVIPGYNDGENLTATHRFLAELGITAVKELPYHRMAHPKYAAVDHEDTLPE